MSCTCSASCPLLSAVAHHFVINHDLNGREVGAPAARLPRQGSGAHEYGKSVRVLCGVVILCKAFIVGISGDHAGDSLQAVIDTLTSFSSRPFF